ncbi:MAG: AGE family epimerase/isomerase [Verrucomicrobia bacterium]|nr:AGE family epimerase/isomerase [Verrucomicrobiota bacterium]
MNARTVLAGLLLGVGLTLAAPAATAPTGSQTALRLLFWNNDDVTDTFGKIVFGAEPLRADADAVGYPNMQFGCEVPRDDGPAWIYGWRLTNWDDKPRRAVEVLRCVTTDGVTFTGAETVWSRTSANWQGFVNIVRRPTDGALFLFSWAPDALHVFRSDDGRDWRLLTDKAYGDHDAMCVTWFAPWGEFLNYQNTLQPFPKRYPDNIGAHRRVLSFRRSKEGVNWENFSPPFLRGERLWVPDADDPADLEFYRSIVFAHQGRYAMILQDYVAPPPEANSRRATTKHGPRSHAEWAISRDGLNWQRPHRETDPTENIAGLPVQGPLVRGDVIRFYLPGGKVGSLPEDRIFYVTCRANGEFSTPAFVMPAGGLFLNADVHYRPLDGATGRAYVMAELRDEAGQVIPGYERAKCLFANEDGHALPLRWGEADGHSLAGRTVRLRFYLRDAKIYSVTLRPDEAPKAEVLDGEFWREQALTQIIPHWFDHVRDEQHGGFHMNLSRRWEPAPPWDKYPAMISRHVFGFSAAYLLSGEEKYLELARTGVDYLLAHAWDEQYGGWFDSLTESGQPKETSKTVPLQLYTDVGLTLYFFVTGDERVLAKVQESVRLRQSRALDKEFGGYVQALHRDLTVKDWSKSKHSHFGYTSSLLINLAIAPRRPDTLSFAEELMALTTARMIDPEHSWVRGFPTPLDRTWRHTPAVVDGHEVVSVGAQLTAALAFLRLHEVTGKDTYRQRGLKLAEQLMRCGWDSARGGWRDQIASAPPHAALGPLTVSWWVQCYGAFLQLHLFHLTGDKRYLEHFKKMADFWNRHFVDAQFGGVFAAVAPDGAVQDEKKAFVWKTSYHEMEFGLLNYLYLNLYVNGQPAKLHFHLRRAKAGAKHFVSLLEDPAVRISGVSINGQPWPDFDAQERSVTLPAGDVKMVVTLSLSGPRPKP